MNVKIRRAETKDMKINYYRKENREKAEGNGRGGRINRVSHYLNVRMKEWTRERKTSG